MGKGVLRAFKVPLGAGILILILFISSFSPILITELSNEKSNYYNIRSSTSNMIDVPVWMVNDEWVYVAGIRGNLSLEDTANQVASGIADELGYDEDEEDRLSKYLRQHKDFSDTWESWRD